MEKCNPVHVLWSTSIKKWSERPRQELNARLESPQQAELPRYYSTYVISEIRSQNTDRLSTSANYTHFIER